MEHGCKIYPPCLATKAGSRPLELCRVPLALSLRKSPRSYASSARCRKRGHAVKSHHHPLKEFKLRQ
jgi:hypothetical protein